MKKRNTLVPPTIVETGEGAIEYSVHKVSASLWPEMRSSLPDVDENQYRKLLVVPTFQECKCPVIEFTEEAAQEKDALLLVFLRFAEALVGRVRALGYWADFIDPTSGYSTVRGASPYCESAAAECFLPYSLQHVGFAAGGCNMISHPKWGLSCYPASIFFLCPLEVFQKTVREMYPEREI
eukprot:TRINITY_DN4653_c1_g2_i1.p1 TRINITY_DN4653_c1_g2~~TRINITY_DN4653_c1_g2_i1.p1  ORF type:complete len:200 (+),score=30.14 TRINITY_DN4653_c1_g2_i1:60-602(+)